MGSRGRKARLRRPPGSLRDSFTHSPLTPPPVPEIGSYQGKGNTCQRPDARQFRQVLSAAHITMLATLQTVGSAPHATRCANVPPNVGSRDFAPATGPAHLHATCSPSTTTRQPDNHPLLAPPHRRTRIRHSSHLPRLPRTHRRLRPLVATPRPVGRSFDRPQQPPCPLGDQLAPTRPPARRRRPPRSGRTRTLPRCAGASGSGEPVPRRFRRFNTLQQCPLGATVCERPTRPPCPSGSHCGLTPR